jgi:hypothetical protein
MHTVGGIVADALTPGATNIQARWRPMHQGHPVPFMPAPDWRCSHQELGPPPHSALPAAGRHCRITLAPAPESTGTARGFTTAALHGWHLDTLIQDAVIVASELVTNAIRHGSAFAAQSGKHAQVELTWQRQASRLICVVTDRSPQPPVLAPADLNAESGRGLQIVHALAPAWGWTMLSAQEKAVWAALQLPLPATRRCADGKPFPGPAGDQAQLQGSAPWAAPPQACPHPQAHPGGIPDSAEAAGPHARRGAALRPAGRVRPVTAHEHERR